MIGITGSKGFVGSRLTEHFQKQHIPFAEFTGDLTDSSDVGSFFDDHKPDIVVHLAGAFSPPFRNQLEKNVLTVQTVLEIGRTRGLRRIIIASSGAVYGEPVRSESRETDPIRPNTLYGVSKKMAEEIVLFYNKIYGIGYTILRFSSIYGEGNDKGVIYRFIHDIRTTGSVTIEGNGTQSRNLLHVQDAVSAIEKAIQHPHNGIFNVSNPVKVTINQIIDVLKTKHTFTVKYGKPVNDLKDLLLDISKAKKELHFSPSVRELSV